MTKMTPPRSHSKGPARISRRAFGIGAGLLVVGGTIFASRWFNVTADAGAQGNLRVEDAHAAALSGAVFLIDIRRPDEWQRTGGGEGAIALDMRRDDFTDALLEETGGRKDAAIALICARGVRSRGLTARLTSAGFTNILDVPEGMLGSGAGPGWLKSGLPVVTWSRT